MRMSNYETFDMNREKNIRDMFTRFMSVINDRNNLEKASLVKIWSGKF